MQDIELKIKRIAHEGTESILPSRGTSGSAGLDLYAAIPEPVEIRPRQLTKIPSGIAVGLPSEGYVGLVFARSGLSIKHGIALSNGVGVIDSDYTGEIIVGLCNVSDESYTISPGERIAQLIVMPVPSVRLLEVEELGETGRSSGGFGSTGKF